MNPHSESTTPPQPQPASSTAASEAYQIIMGPGQACIPRPVHGLRQEGGHVGAGQVEVGAGRQVSGVPGGDYVVAHAAKLDHGVDCGQQGQQGSRRVRGGLGIRSVAAWRVQHGSPWACMAGEPLDAHACAWLPNALQFCIMTARRLEKVSSVTVFGCAPMGLARSSSSLSSSCTPAYSSTGVRGGSSQGAASNSARSAASFSGREGSACSRTRVRQRL